MKTTNFFRLAGIVVWLTIAATTIHAQGEKPAFWNDIQAFKKQDSASFPAAGQIVFTGSSSFTMWRDVQKYFPNHPIINRGFGGSTLLDVIRYVDDVVTQYKPKQVVIYCGENDLAASDKVDGKIVAERFEQLFGLIRKKNPGVPVVFVSLKPSPSRAHLFEKMKEANRLVREFLAKQKSTAFVDVYTAMIEADGQPTGNLFLEDKLHMNGRGYAIWQRLIKPHLLK